MISRQERLQRQEVPLIIKQQPITPLALGLIAMQEQLCGLMVLKALLMCYGLIEKEMCFLTR